MSAKPERHLHHDAVEGMAERIEQLEVENAELKARVARLETELVRLQDLVGPEDVELIDAILESEDDHD